MPSQDLLARDCVLVFSGDVNKFPYVGRIVSLWQDSGSGKESMLLGFIQICVWVTHGDTDCM